MNEYTIPLKKPKPDIARFLKAMRGETAPEKPPLVEYLVDDAIMKPVVTGMLGRPWVDAADSTDGWLDNVIEFWLRMGYDFVRMEISLPLPAAPLLTADTARGNEGRSRSWQDEHAGPIRNREDFERYPWPEINDDDFYVHRYVCGHLPDGMGFMTCHAGGVYEHASRLMGYENLCLKLFDDPGLVRDVADRLGGIILQYYRRLLSIPGVSVIFQGEDFGFNTQTLISPADIRSIFLPWHERYARMIHDAGKPFYLHSCGAVQAIMEDLIRTVKIDGKHSFQDGVMPVWEAKEKYGDRICILGGVDVHKLSTLEPESLRGYVRSLIERCAPGGRFAVGAGNSIPSYVPLENYLVMIDESLR
jgi:uroporphyrinogen decarboxylase